MRTTFEFSSFLSVQDSGLSRPCVPICQLMFSTRRCGSRVSGLGESSDRSARTVTDGSLLLSAVHLFRLCVRLHDIRLWICFSDTWVKTCWLCLVWGRKRGQKENESEHVWLLDHLYIPPDPLPGGFSYLVLCMKTQNRAGRSNWPLRLDQNWRWAYQERSATYISHACRKTALLRLQSRLYISRRLKMTYHLSTRIL